MPGTLWHLSMNIMQNKSHYLHVFLSVVMIADLKSYLKTPDAYLILLVKRSVAKCH